MNARLDRKRGTALLVVVIMLLVSVMLAGVLLAVPQASFDRQISSERREAALLAADAGIREAIIRLRNGTIVATATAPYPSGFVEHQASTMSTPQSFGTGKFKSYQYGVKLISTTGGLFYLIDAIGTQEESKVAVDSTGAVTGAKLQVEIEVLVEKPPPPTAGFGGAYNVSNPNSVNANFYAKFTGNAAINGNDGAGGASVLGLAMDSRTNFGGAPPAASSLQTVGTGNALITGSAPASPVPASPTVPGSGTQGTSSVGTINQNSLDSFFAATTQVSGTGTYGQIGMQSDITGGEAVINATNINITGPNAVGSFANPVATIIRPTSIPTQPLLNMTGQGQYFGIVIIDLTGLTGSPLTFSQSLVNITGNGSMNGIVLINMPNAPYTPDNSHAVMKVSGNGGLAGTIAVQLNGSVASSPPLFLADITGNGQPNYNSANIQMALMSLNLIDWKVISYQVVTK